MEVTLGLRKIYFDVQTDTCYADNYNLQLPANSNKAAFTEQTRGFVMHVTGFFGVSETSTQNTMMDNNSSSPSGDRCQIISPLYSVLECSAGMDATPWFAPVHNTFVPSVLL